MTRIRLAWNVLRGRPTGYRLTIFGTFGVPQGSGTALAECHIVGDGRCTTITVNAERTSA